MNVFDMVAPVELAPTWVSPDVSTINTVIFPKLVNVASSSAWNENFA